MATSRVDRAKEAVEVLHECKATFREAVELHERFQGHPVYDGLIYVFDLEGHPTASRCYAFAFERDDPPGRQFQTVLHAPPVDSPEKALRAAIVHQYQQQTKG